MRRLTRGQATIDLWHGDCGDISLGVLCYGGLAGGIKAVPDGSAYHTDFQNAPNVCCRPATGVGVAYGYVEPYLSSWCPVAKRAPRGTGANRGVILGESHGTYVF